MLDVAWRMVREEGTDALTLGRVAERAGVTKPLAYDHFGTRDGLLVALYGEFDARQTALMYAALEAAPPKLAERAAVIAGSYIDCVMQQGHEIPGVIAALAGSPELERVRREWEAGFIDRCRHALAPFAGPDGVPTAGLRAMLGAAEALSAAAATAEITPMQAQAELYEIIIAMVDRSTRRPPRKSGAGRESRRRPPGENGGSG
ncbi:TetR/AcrR family transcriptional regulator [Luteimonas sp. BDR2-5]|uniref:TetR/AcrR family transcriptional regulator n=1 Tax=Proluteimonas luteida TaxID=2878685 RepID=UPI0021074107|nr:TetR/AcrR family transcriptional regulator [Luteimonas sp. BDR2-5]